MSGNPDEFLEGGSRLLPAPRRQECSGSSRRLHPDALCNIMRLKAAGERELVPMRWGFAGKDHANPARAARPWTGFAPSPRRSAPPLLLRHARRFTLKAMGDRLGNE